jgi:hypothetical protein
MLYEKTIKKARMKGKQVPKAGSDVRRTQGKGYQVRPPHANPC